MKKAQYYEDAKRMYVNQGFDLDTIAKLLQKQVSRRTLYNWKQDNAWDESRKKFLASQEGIQDELVELLKATVKEARAKPSPHNIYSVVKMISALNIFQKVDLEPGDEENNNRNITPDSIKLIKREILGMG